MQISELQALDNYPPFLYEPLRDIVEKPRQMNKSNVSHLIQEFQIKNRDILEAFADDHMFDIEFVNEELCEIPDEIADAQLIVSRAC